MGKCSILHLDYNSKAFKAHTVLHNDYAVSPNICPSRGFLFDMASNNVDVVPRPSIPEGVTWPCKQVNYYKCSCNIQGWPDFFVYWVLQLSYKVSSALFKERSCFQLEPNFLLGYNVGKMWRKDTKEGPTIVKQGKGRGFSWNFKYAIRICQGDEGNGKCMNL